MQNELTNREMMAAGINMQTIRKFQMSENWFFAVDENGTVHIKDKDPYDFMDDKERVQWDKMPDVRTFKSVDRLAGYMEGFESVIDTENRSRLIYMSAQEMEARAQNMMLRGDRASDEKCISVPNAKLIDNNGELYVEAQIKYNDIMYDARMDVEKIEYGNLPVYGCNHPNIVFVNAVNETWRTIVNVARLAIDRIAVSSYVIDNYELDSDGRIVKRLDPNAQLFGLAEVSLEAVRNPIEDLNSKIEEIRNRIFEDGGDFEQYRQECLRELTSLQLPTTHDRREEVEQEIERLKNLTDEEHEHESDKFELAREVWKGLKASEEEDDGSGNCTCGSGNGGNGNGGNAGGNASGGGSQHDAMRTLVAMGMAAAGMDAQDISDVYDGLANTTINGVAPGQ